VILDDEPGRRPQTLGGAVYLAVVGGVVIGLAITVVGAWRTGVSWMGAGLIAGGLFRLALPERRAGMLRVRRKVSDVTMLVLAGIALVVLAVIVPEQAV